MTSCTYKADGAYDYDKALNHMRSASRKIFAYLVSCLQAECIFLRKEKSTKCDASKFGGEMELSGDFDTDTQALDILATCYPKNTAVPVSVSGDGNCLFNALSKLFIGDESLSKELRVRTAIEMVTNMEIYKSDPRLKKSEDFSPSYTDSLRNCARVGGYSSAWTIKALSSVL